MFPTTEIDGSPGLPAEATFWTPKRSEIDEEGFGFFRGVWPLLDVSVSEARQLVETERKIATLVGELASDDSEFELLALAVERGDEDGELSPEQMDVLCPHLAEEESSPLCGLELGVAGLSHALSMVRMFPAASCRGHPGPHAWSDSPVVYVASDQFRAERLRPLAAESGCRFTVGSARPDLLAIGGGSILATMRLAELVIEHRADFKRKKPVRPAATRPPSHEPRLF